MLLTVHELQLQKYYSIQDRYMYMMVMVDRCELIRTYSE